ncbi:UDP-N-acetylmuramoylalanine--D-glutamate ligase [Syntrophobotulus glycolicus DSM 8271]|uniref:UDP-N-acetylmuramoylalanine--D-glutamate ligase n=1 Tax=Syntrophobotulus glycolicus (strain DSM 8271 / FlGlyR) TaxID=645991 RepID=F0SZZ7_SYNGF|nr:UDP-N-acetylmuramoyl-L-alanine--D-glutamate ligase [Syntrophobotulus glycolicus]ADY55008.1 UDP-N-acetylmuramoylalanine--D-glutamate ligase [Syntrophobotulus glycolicus DSM 8271]
MNWPEMNVLVVGAGKSGKAAVQKLLDLGAEVFLTDRQQTDQIEGINELGLAGDRLILGRDPDVTAIKPDLIVLSPGISPELAFIREATEKGIPVWSEVELALRDCQALVVGITGSNGKTTTTTLIGELAKKTGRPAVVAGNIGTAISGKVEGLGSRGIVVAELSSFQLELIDRLRVNIAVLINITPDHLDRHGTLENYAAAKARIFENQTGKDLAVLSWDYPMVREYGKITQARVTYISTEELLADGIGLSGNDLVWSRDGKTTKIIARNELQLRGKHNLENVMCGIAVGLEMGLSGPQIAEVLRGFAPVAHRQEVVGSYDGILYINDSKGTNPDSAIKALQSYEEPIVLIAGGKNKGLDMTEFLEEAKKRVKSLVLVGKAADDLEIIAKKIGIKNIIKAVDFEDCVDKAIAEAAKGDVVLLSPACTSWDMFKSYEERGELFKTLVRKHYSKPI